MSRNFDITAQPWRRFTFARRGRVLPACIGSDHRMRGVDQPMHEVFARVFTVLQCDTDSDADLAWARVGCVRGKGLPMTGACAAAKPRFAVRWTRTVPNITPRPSGE